MVVGGRELIDTLWNVNTSPFSSNELEIPELIDTLWNVNTSATGGRSGDVQELIDTLWNVNYLIQQISATQTRN